MKLLNLALALITIFSVACSPEKIQLSTQENIHDMQFNNLANTWDEAIPLGNAVVGSLIWQKDSNLRMSIDRIDLWDQRDTPEFQDKDFNFKWVYEHVIKDNYQPVHEKLDYPYRDNPGPSKIPGAGVEFSLKQFGEVESVHLYQRQAVCEVKWKSGERMQSFVHANKPIGIFIFDGIDKPINPILVPPAYENKDLKNNDKNIPRQSLIRLGYKQGQIEQVANNKLVYTQKGWGDFYYTAAIKWKYIGRQLYGVWSITSSKSNDNASEWVDKVLEEGVESNYLSHCEWWKDFYSRSSVSLPDKKLEKQYYNEIYKMGSIAREYTYPISLQAVWTADNGQLPPWKGDYHHDLNTELSYWPFYTGNYLKEETGFLNSLWNQRDENKKYTRHFFGTEGLNVPGVSTLDGKPMGGWAQYAMGPTVSAWLSHHFYLHWKYSQDRDFLKNRAYPYIKDVAIYLEQIMVKKDGIRTLPLSASPEFNDNRIDAWFKEMTNFDRALTHFIFGAAAELAKVLGNTEEAKHWQTIKSELPNYILDKNGGLLVAENFPYESSHRHFSHLLAIHPLGLIDYSNSEKDKQIINQSIVALEKYGPDTWCGYSYSWLSIFKARMFDGEGAAEALRIFSDCFCLKNGFHANGDQSNTGKSKFTYRPFTLEGNMAFAAGIQEMLLQSHTGVIHVFPAIPKSWKDVSFHKLRAIGAFLVNAELKNGKITQISILSEKGGNIKIKNSFGNQYKCTYDGKVIPCINGIWEFNMSKETTCIIK